MSNVGDTDTADAADATLLAHRDKLLGFIRSKVSDPQAAEDILHDSLIKAMSSLSQLEDEEKLVSWFYQLVRNAIIDRYRRKQTEDKYLDKYARDTTVFSTPEEQANVCACFREMIPGLKDEYREMIESVELGEADPKQVAAELGITANNLKVRRHRARQKLKEQLVETCGECAARGCVDCTCQA